MKLSKARLEPIPETQWSDKVKEILREIKVGQGEVPNIFKTLAHHPDLMRRWLVFGNHVLFKSTVPARERDAPPLPADADGHTLAYVYVRMGQTGG